MLFLKGLSYIFIIFCISCNDNHLIVMGDIHYSNLYYTLHLLHIITKVLWVPPTNLQLYCTLYFL